MPYLHVTIKVRAGKVDQVFEALGHVIPRFEEMGWTLVGAWQTSIGRLYTLYDLWEIPDANAVGKVFAAAFQDPEIAKWAAYAYEVIEEESLQVLEETPYMRLGKRVWR